LRQIGHHRLYEGLSNGKVLQVALQHLRQSTLAGDKDSTTRAIREVTSDTKSLVGTGLSLGEA